MNTSFSIPYAQSFTIQLDDNTSCLFIARSLSFFYHIFRDLKPESSFFHLLPSAYCAYAFLFLLLMRNPCAFSSRARSMRVLAREKRHLHSLQRGRKKASPFVAKARKKASPFVAKARKKAPAVQKHEKNGSLWGSRFYCCE